MDENKKDIEIIDAEIVEKPEDVIQNKARLNFMR